VSACSYRLWPRGLRKDDAHFEQWRKDLSPSTALRQFYGHRPERFAEFASRYRKELRRKEAVAAISEIVALADRVPSRSSPRRAIWSTQKRRCSPTISAP